ncbi:glycosyltransferase family 9 protein [Oxalobacteraceae bacterium R-40]|uniref:Glycosyltransferase family 9 protein n=1 Tax=Keguizhuia sedimenti TaxID=3064264 RepID=A0ABU1BP60_9BURK|nr:glycosyltransferase family 9 protein [Oxalobacteraceae bacterium R-40]
MKRILIVRTSAIGDVVFASPLAHALRQRYPEAHIAWLIEPGLDALIENDPAIDERIIWPKSEWKALWRDGRRLELLRRVLAFRRLLRSKRFDAVLDLQGLLKSGLLAWMTGASRRIGLGSKEGSQYLMTEVVPRGGDSARISSEYLHLAQHLGLPVDDFMPVLHVSAEVEARTLERLAEHGLAPGKYAVFAAFTTRPQKHWFADAWRSLAPLLLRQTGLTPLLLGGPGDVDAAADLARGEKSIVNMVGKTRLDETVAIIKHAGAVIGVDTGLTHMGIAFDVPTIALFGSTCPYTNTGRSSARVIWLNLPCAPCKRNPTCGGAFTCMRDITPQRVANELDMALRLAA